MSTKRAGRIRRRIAGAVAALAAAASIGVVQAAPAQAIEPCTFWTPNPLSIGADPFGWGPSSCWANPGTRYVNLPGQRMLDSGNNAGYVLYQRPGSSRLDKRSFGKFERKWLNNVGITGYTVTVRQIVIY
ncbi:hypothetical protein KVF89_16740 [Nocardioides carbamazepini]|uniref:hypothetical protein n=1 Tax=Nocardioides carbamazepini TaxID=2854259 RepID=UPI002149E789|nr:hypothetical protein [Nocardioides carbamazepini]MCR1784190.1 hypothetical protein [Nocardioides carbamazepini]